VRFSKHPSTRIHLVVLALCVGACLWIALGGSEEQPARPEDEAALVRDVLGSAQ